MRVNHSTSPDYSYAVGGYFVDSMPGWFVVRLGDTSKSPLYLMVKRWSDKKYSNALPVGLKYEIARLKAKKIPTLRSGSGSSWWGLGAVLVVRVYKPGAGAGSN